MSPLEQKKKQACFTIGELANLYHIPKQTLIYYSNAGLLIPSFIEKNGYRYYSVDQFHELEIILNLRKLDVPIKEIRAFLENRSPAALTRLLERQKAEDDRLIEAIREKQTAMEYLLSQLKQQVGLPLGVFQTTWLPTREIYASDPVPPDADSAARMQLFSDHVLSIFGKDDFRNTPPGWIIRQSDFFGENQHRTWRYFVKVTSPKEEFPTIQIPAGLYVRIFFSGTYTKNYKELYGKLNEYLSRNHLEVSGDVIVQSIKDYWQTSNETRYITEFSLPVRSLE